MENLRLWGRIVRHHKNIRSETVEVQDNDIESAILSLCHTFDIQRPLQLPKHDRDIAEYGHTFYTADHFTEPISFDRFEIEIIRPDARSHNPLRAHKPIEDV